MKVAVQLKGQSQPIEYDQVVNTYQKSDMFCVYLKSETVHKFPMQNIWRIVEDYGYHGQRQCESSSAGIGVQIEG